MTAPGLCVSCAALRTEVQALQAAQVVSRADVQTLQAAQACTQSQCATLAQQLMAFRTLFGSLASHMALSPAADEQQAALAGIAASNSAQLQSHLTSNATASPALPAAAVCVEHATNRFAAAYLCMVLQV